MTVCAVIGFFYALFYVVKRVAVPKNTLKVKRR